MTNPERDPVEQWCQSGSEVAVADRPDVEVLTARDVPLGGPRAMTVRRTLPQRARSLIGAWCFADHYGPDDVAETGGMDVAPHPHTGLQTVSWLFSGEIEHRDSLGIHAYVRPGELNLMTGGHGICHSEVSTAGDHGPARGAAVGGAARRRPARPPRLRAPRARARSGSTARRLRVFLGSLAGSTSPVPTFTPLLGAELVLEPRARRGARRRPGFEHGLLVDNGQRQLSAPRWPARSWATCRPGAAPLTLSNRDRPRAGRAARRRRRSTRRS